MLRSMLCLGRDENGYPADGIDIVSERPKPKNPISELIALLQQANKREEELKDKVDYWHRKYNHLYADYIALKYDDLCLTCQKIQDSTRSGKTYTLCESCAAGRQTIESLQRELKKERQDSIYWQECYETALKELSECDYTLSQQ